MSVDTTIRSWQTFDPVTTALGDLTVTVRGTGEGNVLGSAFWTELGELITLLDMAGDTRCLVLRGAGEKFSAGLDLRWYLLRLGRARRAGTTVETVRDDVRRMQRVINALATGPCVSIALIDGECTGAAFELVAACDLRVATRAASFCLPEADLGLVPDLGGLQRLARIVGDGVTRRLVLTGEPMTAADALRTGLVTDLYETTAEAESALEALCASIRSKPRAAVSEARAALDRIHEEDLSLGLERAANWNSTHVGVGEWERRMGERLSQVGAVTR